MIVTVNSSNFDTEVLQSDKTVMLDFWAEWCAPCRMLSPIVDEISEERSDIKVCKVNVDEEGELAVKYNVMSIPTIAIFKNGELVKKTVGAQSKQALSALLD